MDQTVEAPLCTRCGEHPQGFQKSYCDECTQFGHFTICRDGKFVTLYAPNSQPQADFHAATEPNVLLEGSRGGGKSWCMRFDAYMRCMAVPGFGALILRRSMPELRISHINFVESEVALLGGTYNKSEFTAYFPNGSRLVFGHCEDDAAINRYLSSQWDGIYFDELVTFLLRQFLLISAAARTKKNSGGRIAIVRAGTNPVGIGSTWVKQYFLDKNPSDENAPNYIPADWRAISVQLVHNVDIDRVDYRKRLDSLHTDALRRAYGYGEWVTEGQFFDEWRETRDGKPWHVIEEMPLLKGKPIHRVEWVEIVRAIDWGYSENEPGCCLWIACLPDNTFIVFQEYVFTKTIPKEVAREIVRRSKGLRVRRTDGDPMMWAERTGEGIAETFRRNGVPMIEADNSRETGWVQVHAMLTETHHDGVSERPRLQVLRGRKDGTGCPALIRAIPTAVVDPKKPQDLTADSEDPLDTLRYAVMARMAKSRKPLKSTLPPELVAIINAAKRRPALGSESVRHR
jgi:hypothetical protein